MELLVPGPVKLLLNDIIVSDMTSSMLLIIGAKRVIAKYGVGEMHIAQRKMQNDTAVSLTTATSAFLSHVLCIHFFLSPLTKSVEQANLYKEISSKKNKNVGAINFSLITCRSF